MLLTSNVRTFMLQMANGVRKQLGINQIPAFIREYLKFEKMEFLSDPQIHFRLSNFCFEHTRVTQLKETRQVIGKFKPFESTETLVNSLAQYVKLDKAKPPNAKIQVLDNDDDEIDVITPSADPFGKFFLCGLIQILICIFHLQLT